MVFKSTKESFSRCCNPLKLPNHAAVQTLRKVPESIAKMFSNISQDHRICDRCRKKLYSMCNAPKTSKGKHNLNFVSMCIFF